MTGQIALFWMPCQIACHHKNKDLAKTVRHDAVAMDKIEKGWHHTAQMKSCILCAYTKGVDDKSLVMSNNGAFILWISFAFFAARLLPYKTPKIFQDVRACIII